MFDGYDRRFYYVVTEILATPGNDPAANLGAIDLIDSSGVSLPQSRAHVKYILFSTGRDPRGAYSKDGMLLVQCPPPPARVSENCDNDSTFVSSVVSSF